MRVAFRVAREASSEERLREELGSEPGKLTDDLTLSVRRLRGCRQESARELFDMRLLEPDARRFDGDHAKTRRRAGTKKLTAEVVWKTRTKGTIVSPCADNPRVVPLTYSSGR